MFFPFGVPVTVITRAKTGARDSDGNYIYAETSAVVTGAFAPGGSTELVQGQDTVISQDTVYLPAGTTVAATDQIQIGSRRWLVDGSPNDWANPFTGWTAGVEVKLQQVNG